MGHINHEIAANFVSNFSESRVIEVTAVGACSCNYDLWSVQCGVLLELIVVNQASFEVASIW